MLLQRSHSVLLSTTLLLPACGAGKAGEAVRPTDLTTADARGQGAVVCHEVQAEGTPLIVDWSPEDRGDLEVAMKQGVAVVHYDCTAIKVLGDCHVDGTYGFIGTTRKEQVISLQNGDEAQANLPFSGAKLGASLSRGSTIDIGLIMIGKKSTTALSLDRSLLTGRCDGATHFVRSATVGAFAMKQGTTGDVKAAADVFGFGASAGSSSAKSAINKDGDVTSCQAADPDAPKPPNGCGAAVRVQLLALSSGAPPAGGDSGPTRDVACPTGMVGAAGRCVAATTVEAHDCDMKNIADCTKQCDAGNAFSCSWSDLTYSLGVDVPQDDAKAATYAEKGCQLGAMDSCTSSGLNYLKGEGVARDSNKGVAELVQSCSGGYGQGCDTLGDMYVGTLGQRIKIEVQPDVPRGVRFYQRACDGGYGYSCGKLGAAYAAGSYGLTSDGAKAKALYKRACAAGDKPSCAKAQ
jgi:hypothetical protein